MTKNSVTHGWSRQKKLDLRMMVESGSMVEAMMDEFALSQSQLSDAIDEVKRDRSLQPERPRMKRTSEGLRDNLFDAMDGLLSGEVEPQTAMAVCAVSTAICKTVELEIKASKHLQNSNRDNVHVLRLSEE